MSTSMSKAELHEVHRDSGQESKELRYLGIKIENNGKESTEYFDRS